MKIFEIIYSDAAARIGKLVLDKEISTPTIIRIHEKDCPIIDSGSLWEKKELKLALDKKIVILPHKSFPLHTREEIMREIQDSYAQEIAHKGIVIHPFTQKYPPSDVYILGAAKQLENKPRELVNSIIRLKENTPADSLLYTPALATPENLSMLVYMGVDIVDETLPVIRAYQDIYLTNSGEFHLDELHEFPCSCTVCSENVPAQMLNMSKKERAWLLSNHNLHKLAEELSNIREHIRSGRLREYVERQCRVKPWLTAELRLVDSQYTFLEKRTPIFRKNTLYANASESLNRVEIKRFAQRVIERYTAPELDTLVLFPCSAKKPYSLSLSHQKFVQALGKYRRYVHEVIISSPLGIVPRELELMYPSAHYDTPVTGHWDLEERAWAAGCLKKYLQKNKYKNIIAHVYGAYREICESVEKELGLRFTYTANEGVTLHSSLDELKEAASEIKNVKKRTNEQAKLDIFRASADYQFGRGAGDMLVNNAAVKASYPKLQLFAEKQLAALVPQYGAIALTIEGGLRLRNLENYKVKIADFIPHGNILAPGVVDADPQIRPNDEVMVEGEKFFGVGRALMSGWEMIECRKGVAVQLRHSKEF